LASALTELAEESIMYIAWPFKFC